MLQAAVAAGFQMAAKTVALSEVESAWSKDTGEARIVFTVD
jgi:hypothetical protein